MQPEGPFKLGLTGWPLGHSLSPRIHQAALRSLGLEGEYSLYPVPPGPDIKTSLAHLMEKLRSGDLHGLNVTIPYKVGVLDLIDDLSPAAQGIGAANTLVCRDGRVSGENTDAVGFLSDLRDLLPQLFTGLGTKYALVLGSGGAARAIVYALLQEGWQVTVASRSLERGQLLAEQFNQAETGQHVSTVQLSAGPIARLTQGEDISLIVNATPAGMAPEIEQNAWPAEVCLPCQAAVYDLVYSPAETLLVKTARQSGLQAYTGLGMLVEQAFCAFEIWTGLRPSREFLHKELKLEKPIS